MNYSILTNKVYSKNNGTVCLSVINKNLGRIKNDKKIFKKSRIDK